MNYKELTKSYPEFKIPYLESAVYYINTLINAGICTMEPVNRLKALEDEVEDIGKYKMKSMDAIIEKFKILGMDLNSIDMNRYKNTYSELNFNNFKENNYYVSLDLKAANWQAFKHAFCLTGILPEWNVFVKSEINLDDFLAESKSYRQLVFGNTNPKRLSIIQKEMMQIILESMPVYLVPHIVGKKADEIILEFNKIPSSYYNDFNSLAIPFQYTIKLFSINNIKSFNETIRVKNIMSFDTGEVIKRKMINVPGNRYFMHLKNIILNQDVTDNDLIFQQDSMLAKWII